MFRPDHLRQTSQFQFVLDLLREVVGAARDRAEVVCCNNDFALRDHNSIDLPTIDDAGNSISQVASENRIHDKNRQAGNVRYKRFGIEQFHESSPAAERVSDHETTTSRFSKSLNRREKKILFCNASCSVPAQELGTDCIALCISSYIRSNAELQVAR